MSVRCSFRHSHYENYSQTTGYGCDGTDQCWVTANPGPGIDDTWLCPFHSAETSHATERGNLVRAYVEQAGQQELAIVWIGVSFDEEWKRIPSVNAHLDFMECSFESLDLSKRDFRRSVTFSDCQFRELADFRSSKFHHSLRMTYCSFKGPTYFNSCRFTGDVSFVEVTSLHTNFAGSHFAGRLQIAAAEYDSFGFTKVECSKEVDIFDLTVASQANLNNGTFQAFSLRAAEFRGTADFSSVSAKAFELVDAHFQEPALFKAVSLDEFSGTNIEFLARADFSDSVLANTRILNVRAHELVTFTNARCEGEFKLTGVFEASLRLNNASMACLFQLGGTYKFVNFDNTVFGEAADFTDVSEFETAPTFYNTEVHEGTTFNLSSFVNTRSKGAKSAYRRLKQIMGDLRAIDEESHFHALELDSKLYSKQTSFTDKFFLLGYRLISGYGRSATAPLLALLLIYLVSAGVYLSLHPWGVDADSVTDALIFSASQVTRPFFIWSESGVQSAKTLFWDGYRWVLAVSLLQTVFSLTAITLLILAIRRKFKL